MKDSLFECVFFFLEGGASLHSLCSLRLHGRWVCRHSGIHALGHRHSPNRRVPPAPQGRELCAGVMSKILGILQEQMNRLMCVGVVNGKRTVGHNRPW